MTTAFITETIDQELQLTDLQQVAGAIPVPVMVGLAWGSGVTADCTGHCFDGGSPDQENIFAPVNVLRNGYDETNPSPDY